MIVAKALPKIEKGGAWASTANYRASMIKRLTLFLERTVNSGKNK